MICNLPKTRAAYLLLGERLLTTPLQELDVYPGRTLGKGHLSLPREETMPPPHLCAKAQTRGFSLWPKQSYLFRRNVDVPTLRYTYHVPGYSV